VSGSKAAGSSSTAGPRSLPSGEESEDAEECEAQSR